VDKAGALSDLHESSAHMDSISGELSSLQSELRRLLPQSTSMCRPRHHKEQPHSLEEASLESMAPPCPASPGSTVYGHVISDGVCEDLRCVGHLAESSGCSKGYKLLGPDSSHQDTQPVASALARVHQEVEAARDRAAEAESEVKRLRAKLEATLHAEAKLARQMAADMATRERESIQTRQKLECATQQLFAYQMENEQLRDFIGSSVPIKLDAIRVMPTSNMVTTSSIHNSTTPHPADATAAPSGALSAGSREKKIFLLRPTGRAREPDEANKLVARLRQMSRD